MRRVDIRRLVIRVRGISPDGARALSSGLGRALLEHLSDFGAAHALNGSHNIREIEAGTVHADSRADAASVQRSVVQAVGRAVNNQIKK